jgi:4-amino-4-deoxy-L-arabinose transferase-like glycosyltransferase
VGLVAIAAVSLAICLGLDLLYFPPTTISADENRFLGEAADLLTTGEFRVGGDRAWEMPGTAVFFASVLSLGYAVPLVAVRIANAILVSVQSVLIGLLTAQIFRDRAAGLLAAAIVGFYPYILFTQSLALSETPFIFMLVAGILALYVWRNSGALVDGRMAAAVMLLTLATLIRGTLTVLPPVLLGAGAIGKRPFSGAVRVIAAASVIYALLMSPWWVRTYHLLGAFVPFTTNSTLNLYLGNSPNNPNVATYTPYLPANWAVDNGVSLMSIPGEIDRYRAFRERAIAYIVSDPAAFIRRAIIKLKVFWNIVPNAPSYRSLPYLIVGATSFGFCLAGSLACVIRRRRQFLDLLPIYLTIAYFTVVYTITIPSIRYRLPIEPLLITLAACPTVTLIRCAVGHRTSCRQA